jgi:hypothetical protein
MFRGLAHPLEHSATIPYLREAHLLVAQRQAVAGRSAGPSTADTLAVRAARTQPEAGSTNQQGVPQAKRAASGCGEPKGGAAGAAGN